jgi:hypothetical protein
MIRDVILAALAALIVDQMTDVSPWVAIRLVRWAADHMYVANTERKARRKQEWEALIRDRESIPTKLLTLFFGLGFGCAGLYCIAARRVPTALKAVWRKICRSIDLEWIGGLLSMAAGLELWDSPTRNGLIAAGVLLGIAVCLVGVEWIFEQVKSAVDRRRLSRSPL